jgi:hypothetical protein
MLGIRTDDMKEFDWLKGDHIESASYEAESESWIVVFGCGAALSISSLWRLIEDGDISATSQDHGHRFGLPKDFDGVAALKSMKKYPIGNVEVRLGIGDLFLTLGEEFELQIIATSAGYEPWQMTHPKLGTWVISGGELHAFKNALHRPAPLLRALGGHSKDEG